VREAFQKFSWRKRMSPKIFRLLTAFPIEMFADVSSANAFVLGNAARNRPAAIAMLIILRLMISTPPCVLVASFMYGF
jgi:hypothetical protein